MSVRERRIQQRHPGTDRCPDGRPLLRRYAAGGGDGAAAERQVHPLAGGDTGPGWKYSGLNRSDSYERNSE